MAFVAKSRYCCIKQTTGADSACVEEQTILDFMLKAANHLSKMPREYRNHNGSYEGVRSTLSRARWQIFWMVGVGGSIVATFVYLSMAAD